jgi:Rps23 Pro-64 3,4-dihydroxylase Tpa1-like proline 4-hydroxylase
MLYSNVTDYIIVIKNAMTHSLCDAILKEFKNSEDWEDTVVGPGLIRKDIRDCQIVGISFPQIIQKNKKVRLKLDKYTFLSASKCIQEYNNKFSHCKIQEDSGYQLLKYSEGGFYTQHTDSYKIHPRSVSCSFILNDDFEGGEFAFFDKELKYKLEKGDAIMFPSNFMYPHEVMPVTKGTRYSIITWFI